MYPLTIVLLLQSRGLPCYIQIHDSNNISFQVPLTPGLEGGVLDRDILGGFQLVSLVLEL